MADNDTRSIPPGWIGGFAESDPAFAYPDPNLSSLPMLGNMDNISLLQRQFPVRWPEFSWQIEKGDESTRCYQMFAPYISRIGYNDAGRIYSIICPQQGLWFEDFLCLNVEVTVTGQRGWTNETAVAPAEGPAPILAADMTVEGRVWCTLGLDVGWEFKALAKALTAGGYPFNKSQAIRVSTNHENDPSQPIFPVLAGLSPEFEVPDFAQHPEAFGTSYIAVGIGPIIPTHRTSVDEFNTAVIDLFNLGSAKMLESGNVLSWNLWFQHPELVDQKEWADHAEKWRKSIDSHHGSPSGDGTVARHFDGSPVTIETKLLDALKELIEKEIGKL